MVRVWTFTLLLAIKVACIEACSCSNEQKLTFLHELNAEQRHIGGLLARVQNSFQRYLNYKDLAEHLLTIAAPDLEELLTEGSRFAETILDNQSAAAQVFNLHVTLPERVRLVVHAGQTLHKLRALERAMCGAGTRPVSQLNNVEDIMSSFIKYKIHLTSLLMIYNCN
ncbi:uncharacterized protein LOC134819412 [Bolinopsis microptera]|uniref:uncharacterized protein LOC134819412 n=1 Tax=Bolinopsis microptera TaxID=2820187 RepID=UPI003079512C